MLQANDKPYQHEAYRLQRKQLTCPEAGAGDTPGNEPSPVAQGTTAALHRKSGTKK
jgi:hypothetical protein